MVIPPSSQGTQNNFLDHRKYPNKQTPKNRGEKVNKGVAKNYIEHGEVHSSTQFFFLPKTGGAGIRMVYNGKYSGINDILWARHLSLPILSKHTRVVKEGNYMSDIKIG